ncbi:hypothetical protein MKW92_046700 [Papaver armeniacum]|nr:hypothetical protein MKW92_046700 [Papaver armeniacum]
MNPPNGCQLSCYLEIWDALRGAAEADASLAQVIVDSASVIITTSDLTTCFEERGIYVLSEPSNLIREN